MACTSSLVRCVGSLRASSTSSWTAVRRSTHNRGLHNRPVKSISHLRAPCEHAAAGCYNTMHSGSLHVMRPGSEHNQEPAKPDNAILLPSFMDGINWYCCSLIGLLFLLDYTPLGPLLQSMPSTAAGLMALQWAAFVVPTLFYAKRQGWDLSATFRLRQAGSTWMISAVLGGAVLWYLLAAAISWRTGIPILHAPVVQDEGMPVMESAVGMLLNQPATVDEWLVGIVTLVVSPAVAEELLFRGLLLTALMQRMGRLDSVLLSGSLFALMHLSISQYFPLCILGFAAGGLALASGSVLPPMLLHASYNAAALVAGAIAQGLRP